MIQSTQENIVGCQALVGLGDPPYPLRVWRRSEAPGSYSKLCVAEAGARVQVGDRVEITEIIHDTHPDRAASGTATCRVRVLGRYRPHRTSGDAEPDPDQELPMRVNDCGRCHTCWTTLREVLDGEQWCPTCNAYRRYLSHGFARGCADPNDTGCPREAPSGILQTEPPVSRELNHDRGPTV